MVSGLYIERAPTPIAALQVPANAHNLASTDWPSWFRPFIVPYYRCEAGRVFFGPLPPGSSATPPFLSSLAQDEWAFERVPVGAWLALIHGGLVRFSDAEFKAHFVEEG